MCKRAVSAKDHQKKPVPMVSIQIFEQIPKYPPGIKISEVLKMTVELSTLSIPTTQAIPQRLPRIRTGRMRTTPDQNYPESEPIFAASLRLLF